MASDEQARGGPRDSGAIGGPHDLLAPYAEASLRLMAGAASPRAVQSARSAAAAGAGDQAVLAPLLAEPRSPEELRARGARALRDWLTRPEPGRRRSAGRLGKRLVARLIVRGAFYLVMLVLVLVILVLLREYDPALDLYALADRLRALWPEGR